MSDEAGRLFLDFSAAKLEQMTKTLADCVERLSEAQVWERGGPHENAVGNLVLHLCGNMRQWILHGVAGQADVRVREEEFSTVGGVSRAELIAMFEGLAEEAGGVIGKLPGERLGERTAPQGREQSVLGAIYQVVGHVQLHVGQIIVLTKQMVGRDLDLTNPRVR